MKKIAIFVSGEGRAAERVVKLFNEGNRVRTVLVVTDDSGAGLLERLKDEDVERLHITDDQWHSKNEEIVGLLRKNDVNLIVLDGFDKVISDEIMESTQGEILRVSSPELAPREVVAALEADLRKPVEKEEEPETEEIDNPTPESEWADALKIQFRPPKIPTTPPEVPATESPVLGTEEETSPEINDTAGENYNPSYNRPFNQPYQNSYPGNNYRPHPHHHHEHEEPMPATWLIWSILVTIFCCFIPGIIAIVFSSQVSSKYYAGDIEGAKRSSRAAEAWIIVSVVLGVVAATLYIPFMLIGGN